MADGGSLEAIARRLGLPPLAGYGLTRVGDATGLDTIGIPVWFATRPASRALSVSQGKGTTAAQAIVSAVMEALEGAVAEQPRPNTALVASADELARRGKESVPFDRLARCLPARVEPGRERAWVRGMASGDGRPVYAPFELVGLDMRSDFPWDRAAFEMSSIGLAAHTEPDAAALHAVLELIEHDASALVESLGPRAAGARRLRACAGIDAGLDALLATLAAADCEPELFIVARRGDVTVAGARVPRRFLARDGERVRICGGYAARLDPVDALIAALLEAVQSRLTDIAGGRDDIPPERYADPGTAADDFAGELALAHLPRPEPLSPRAGLARAVAAVGAEVFLFTLASGDERLGVVRALALDLAVSAEGRALRLGPTGLAMLLGEDG